MKRRGTPLYKMLRHKRAVEYKMKDTVLDGAIEGEIHWLTGFISGVSGAGIGNTAGGVMIGNKGTVCSISMKVVFENPQASADPTVVRCLVIQDTNYNQTAPGNWGTTGFSKGLTVTPPFASTDVLETEDPVSMVNFMNRSRFRILYDKTFVMAAQYLADTAEAAASKKWISHNFACNINVEAVYNATGADGTASATQFGKNQLYFMFVTDAGDDQTTVSQGVVRVRFSDS